MSELTIIQGPCHPEETPEKFPSILLTVDRSTLVKRRWRGVAENGKEFGFDLEHSLSHGDYFFIDDGRSYLIEQTSENVLEIPITEPESAAKLAWRLGNLHLTIQVLPHAVRVMDDPTMRKTLKDIGSVFEPRRCVFLPLSAGGHHHHHHHHHHHGHSHD